MPDQLVNNGFAIALNVLDNQQLNHLHDTLAHGVHNQLAPGVRGLLGKCPQVGMLANSPGIRQLVEPILGSNAAVVRAIFFNKSVTANWQVAWHQDLTIAVKARCDVPGFDR